MHLKDDEYLPITGGVLTGNLVLDTNSGLYTEALIIKSTRTSGYAFQVHNEASTTLLSFIPMVTSEVHKVYLQIH